MNVENEPDVGPTTLLVDYLRDKAGLKGTKFCCREGGCGSCVVWMNAQLRKKIIVEQFHYETHA